MHTPKINCVRSANPSIVSSSRMASLAEVDGRIDSAAIVCSGLVSSLKSNMPSVAYGAGDALIEPDTDPLTELASYTDCWGVCASGMSSASDATSSSTSLAGTSKI